MTRHSGFADGLEQVVFQPIGDGITQVAQHLDECRVVRFVEFLQIVFRVQIHGRVAPPLPFPQTHRLPLVLDLTEKAFPLVELDELRIIYFLHVEEVLDLIHNAEGFGL